MYTAYTSEIWNIWKEEKKETLRLPNRQTMVTAAFRDN